MLIQMRLSKDADFPYFLEKPSMAIRDVNSKYSSKHLLNQVVNKFYRNSFHSNDFFSRSKHVKASKYRILTQSIYGTNPRQKFTDRKKKIGTAIKSYLHIGANSVGSLQKFVIYK